MAVQYGIPVLNCVLNNAGYLSIRDMQASLFGEERTIATELTLPRRHALLAGPCCAGRVVRRLWCPGR